MATVTWIGEAQEVTEVQTLTPNDGGGGFPFAQGHTITLTIGTKSVVITIGTLITEEQVAVTIKEAWEGETLTDTSASYTPDDGGQAFTEFTEITATVAGKIVTLTHDTAGWPFTVTVTESEAWDIDKATSTAATGPNHADDADNWNGGIPGAFDDIVFENSDVSVLFGLDGLTGTHTSCTVWSTYTGDIGLPETSDAGYPEYRQTYLDMEATTIVIGRGPGDGSRRIKFDTKTVATNISVEFTGESANEFGAVQWNGANAANVLDVRSGSVSVAPHLGNAVTLETVRNTAGSIDISRNVTFAGDKEISNQSGSINVERQVDTPQTITTFSNESGSIVCHTTITTLTSDGGVFVLGGVATIGTLNLNGGTLDLRSAAAAGATITTANIGGTIDCSNDNTARTITNGVWKVGGRIIDPKQTITKTNAFTLDSEVNEMSAS